MTALLVSPPHRRSPPECDWCFDPLGDVVVELNGAFGHPWCAQYTYESVSLPGALPWRPTMRRFYREDPLIDFCRRLGREATKVGIDQHRLAIAIGRASNG